MQSSRIVCTCNLKQQPATAPGTLFCRKVGKMSQNLSSAAVLIGALRVRCGPKNPGLCMKTTAFPLPLYSWDNAKVKHHHIFPDVEGGL